MHGTEGKVYDRVSMTWLDRAEYARRHAVWEEAAFQRGGNQGDLATPMFIPDTMRPVQSQTDGRVYDSKHMLRREYRRAGVVEVGNDAQHTRATPSRDERDREKKKLQASIGRAFDRAGIPPV